jgi:hypothetical protein
MVDYESAIRKPFGDASKLIIGIIVSLVPVINFFSMGFILESTGFGKTKKSKKMPDWKNWPNLFVRGFFGFLVSFVYVLPALVFFALAFGVAVFSMMANVMAPVISSDFIEAAINDQIEPSFFTNMFSENWPSAISSIMRATPLFIVGGLLYLVGIYLTPIGIVNYMKKKKISAAFDLRKVVKTGFTSKYFVVWFVNALISMFALWLLLIIPVLGGSVHFFIIGLITYSLYGDVLRELKL